jgi:hypothetical protein
MVRKLGSILGDIAKKLTAGSSWKGRVGRGLSYFAAGQGASSYIQFAADERRNYYGDKGYEQRFGSGADTLSGSAEAVGLYYGIFGALGRDPISRIKNTGMLKYARHQNRVHAKVTGKVTGRLNAKSSDILGRDPHYGAGPKLVQGRRTFPRPGHEYGDRARFVNEPSKNRRIGALTSQYKSHSPEAIKKLADTPRAGIVRPLAWASVLGMPSGHAGEAMGWLGENAGASAGVVGAGIGGFAAGYAITKMGASKSLIGAGVIGGAGYMGYRTASRDNNAAAEGTITSFDRYNSSGVGRMNFSTAGLVQALHNNNRRH